jgi:hypothetical protein
MSGLGCVHGGKVTVGRVFASAVALLATGFLFAAGYDIYTRLFKKQA